MVSLVVLQRLSTQAKEIIGPLLMSAPLAKKIFGPLSFTAFVNSAPQAKKILGVSAVVSVPQKDIVFYCGFCSGLGVEKDIVFIGVSVVVWRSKKLLNRAEK